MSVGLRSSPGMIVASRAVSSWQIASKSSNAGFRGISNELLHAPFENLEPAENQLHTLLPAIPRKYAFEEDLQLVYQPAEPAEAFFLAFDKKSSFIKHAALLQRRRRP